ncbi:MAG: ABC transporter permease subunit [Cypionkella sp.]|nr:ABC transporter permease subunit [Cypionkella sp.]
MGAAIYQVIAPNRSRQGPGPKGHLRLWVLVVVALCLVLPIAASLWQALRAAFGVLPALGQSQAGLDTWAALFDVPGIASALRLSLVTGFASTLLSLLLALALVAMLSSTAPAKFSARLLAPFLAIPHAAMAVGLAFVLAPSGWIARALAPALGWALPPDLATVGDPYGAALTLGLIIKEMPFMVLVIMTALTQIPLAQHMAAGQALGYGRAEVWVRVIVPQIWPLIRLPIYIVLAFGLSVIDMAVILGPTHPPTLSVLLTRLFTSPDLAQLLPASAGAVLLLAMVVASFAALYMGEKLLARLGREWAARGRRNSGLNVAVRALAGAAGLVLILGAMGAVALALWSMAWRWAWPQLLPSGLSLQTWANADWITPAMTTITIALASTAMALAFAIAWLEGEDRAERQGGMTQMMIYLPLLIPQISFLFGMNILAVQMGIGGGVGAVIWAHVLFVFPYVMMALTGPWRALDGRYAQTAAALGMGPWCRLALVKLPIMAAPILAAVAIGLAVSVAQYLPTLFLGAGRIATLTTEAVTLSSSSDRRVLGVVASMQAVLPLVGYLLAFLIPAWLHKNRRDLQGAA